jgi:hypothetical protein
MSLLFLDCRGREGGTEEGRKEGRKERKSKKTGNKLILRKDLIICHKFI